METKTRMRTKLLRIVIVAVAVFAGVAIIANFVSKRQPPARVEVAETQKAVRVIPAQNYPLVIEAAGFGTARPVRSWSAVSNVKGSVIYRHPDLESGALLPEGTLLLEVDPAAYELALTEAAAEIAGIDAEIAQLRQEQANVVSLLELERQRLELAEADLERTRALVDSGAMAQSVLDTQLRATLQQRQAVRTLENQINVIPIQLERLATQRDRATAKQAQVARDLEDTKIRAPFDLRIGEVKVVQYQYVNPGQLLFSGDGTEAAEVVLQVPMQSLRRVLGALPSGDTLDLGVLDADVRLIGEEQIWPAEVIRIANGIDPATRTVGVVLHIPQEDSMADPLADPPLPKGMFVKGSVRVPAPAPALVIPQAALHEGQVYLVDADSRLERRDVETAFRQNGLVVVTGGLEIGEQVVLDDIVPAIDGIRLMAERDTDAEQALKAAAAGETP